MILILSMAIRVIILISPFVIFLFLLAKKRFNLFSILIVILLLCNSIFMLFSNINQKNIIDMNSLDINKIAKVFADIDINESKTNQENIYIYDQENEFNEIAEFKDITYRKYYVSNDINNAYKEIVTDSAILKEMPQLIQNDSGISFFSSDLKRKMSLWNLLYNSSIYNGCIVIEYSDEIYYMEYEVELSGEKSNAIAFFEQILYRLNFDHKIDVMKLFENPVV